MLFLTPTCPTAVLSGLRIVALFNELIILQKKAIRIINFQPKHFITSPLFKQNFILKFQDKICLGNILFISKSVNNLLPSVFNTWFSFLSDQHNYETSNPTQGNLIKLFCKTITVKCCRVTEQNLKTKDLLLRDLSIKIKLKQLLVIFILNHINNSLIMQKLYLTLIKGIIAIILKTFNKKKYTSPLLNYS